MVSSSSRASRRRFPLHYSVLLFVGCSTSTLYFTVEQDQQAIALIAGRWTAASDGGVTLSLCEDLQPPPEEVENECQVAHVVRGGDRSRSDVVDLAGGCGGCPFGNVAFVQGTVEAAGFAAPVAVNGQVRLGTGAGDEPYDFPYTVELRCTDSARPCTLYGWLDADGSLELTVERGDPQVAGNPETHHVAARIAAATCDAT